MFKRILVATDFSSVGNGAIGPALDLAKRSGAEVVLAYVSPDVREEYSITPIEARWEGISKTIEEMQEEVLVDARKRLDELVAANATAGVRLSGRALVGPPYVEIIHLVKEEKFDLVFAGTRRNISGWERFFLGSQTRRLVQKCPSSLWVVKNGACDAIKSIVVAVDFSPVSQRALTEAKWLATTFGAKLTAVHVIGHGDVPVNLFGQPAKGDWRTQFEARAAERFAAFLQESTAPDVEKKIVWGEPAEQIGVEAAQAKANLLVLGTVGHGAVAGLLLGSTAEKVLESADCNVLAVKPQGFVSPVSKSI